MNTFLKRYHPKSDFNCPKTIFSHLMIFHFYYICICVSLFCTGDEDARIFFAFFPCCRLFTSVRFLNFMSHQLRFAGRCVKIYDTLLACPLLTLQQTLSEDTFFHTTHLRKILLVYPYRINFTSITCFSCRIIFKRQSKGFQAEAAFGLKKDFRESIQATCRRRETIIFK